MSDPLYQAEQSAEREIRAAFAEFFSGKPARATLYPDEQGRAGGGQGRMAHRCVYGYWKAA